MKPLALPDDSTGDAMLTHQHPGYLAKAITSALCATNNGPTISKYKKLVTILAYCILPAKKSFHKQRHHLVNKLWPPPSDTWVFTKNTSIKCLLKTGKNPINQGEALTPLLFAYPRVAKHAQTQGFVTRELNLNCWPQLNLNLIRYSWKCT